MGYNKEYYEKHKEKFKEYTYKYRRNHKEHMKELNKKYRKNKKDEYFEMKEEIDKYKEVVNRLKVVYTSMQFSAPENMYIFIEQMGDLLEKIE